VYVAQSVPTIVHTAESVTSSVHIAPALASLLDREFPSPLVASAMRANSGSFPTALILLTLRLFIDALVMDVVGFTVAEEETRLLRELVLVPSDDKMVLSLNGAALDVKDVCAAAHAAMEDDTFELWGIMSMNEVLLVAEAAAVEMSLRPSFARC